MKCRWTNPGLFKGVKPAAAKKVLDEIRARDGLATAEAIVNEARNRRNPLHKCFDWNDSSAAEKYRLQQAQTMLRCLIVIGPKGQDTEYRAYVHVNTEGGRGFTGIVEALGSPDTRDYLLARATAEMESFERKYAKLSELAEVIATMKTARAKLRKKRGCKAS